MIPVGIISRCTEDTMLKTIGVSLVRDEQGQDLIEYAVMAGLISILSLVLSNVARAFTL